MQQEQAIQHIQDGKNVFLTGPAGSGKTFVLQQCIDWLKAQGKTVAITASTGIAATHLGGTTIHSWAGIGIKDYLSPQDIDNLQQKEHLYKRFRMTDVLIIDEISMLHSYRLDMVDAVLRSFLQTNQPFGGIQIILAGDFFQLPPINRGVVTGKSSNFAFESYVWEQMGLQICYLDTVYRQSNDPLLQVLQEMRAGKLTEQSIELLQERMEAAPDDTLTPTKLYTHNVDVDALNAAELAQLPKAATRYAMTSTGKKADVELLKKNCLAPENLELKIGAQVMFVKNNFSAGYVNGTLGTVTGFEFGQPVVQTAEGKNITVYPDAWMMEHNGNIKAQIQQLPLRLAWAITVHKSQGMTLDAVEVDLSKSFAAGMGYVALSRVKSIAGLYIRGMNQHALRVDPLVQQCDELFRMQST